jgi:hemoglobin/transferrin/lactoferrin receptor protein
MTIPAALRLLALSLTCSLAVQAAAPAIPQEEAAVGSILLPEKIITATRLPASSISAPYAVRELTSGQIDERLPRTLPEALRETPGVSVQKTSNGQGSPHIRGFTGFRTLAMIDGVRFNNSTFRDGPNQYWSTIDLLSADRIELVPGQGSVLYGSDAIGGTVNVLTKSSGFRQEAAGAFFLHGLSSYRYSSAEDSHLGHAELSTGVGGKWGLHVDGSYGEFGDVRAAGLGRQPKTGYDQWSYNVRFDAALDPDWTLTAVHQQLQQDDVWRTHSTVFGVSWQGTTVGNDLRRSFDQDRTLSYVKLDGQNLGSLLDSASLTLSYQTAGETLTRVRHTGASAISEVDLGTWGADLQLSSQTAIGRLTYGMDYYRDRVDSSNVSYQANGAFDKRSIQGPVGDDSTYDLLGAYLQDEITLGERVHVFLGGRYTYARAEVGQFEDPITKTEASLTDSWNDLSSSARLVLDLDAKDQYALFAGVSQGFRAPNLSDVSRLDIARSGEMEIAGNEVDPEKFLNLEIGAKAATESITASVSLFHTRIDDLIVRQPTGRIVDDLIEVSKANGGEGYVQGIELAGSVAFNENWSVFAAGSYTAGEVDQFPGSDNKVVREPLSRVVPFMGTLGLRLQTADRRLWTELVCTAASAADKLNSGERADTQRFPVDGTPGWTLLTLRGGWKLNENVSLTASLDNLLDEEYRAHGSGSNEPGFGGTVGVTVQF